MTWKPIEDAPRDGTVLILGRVDCSYVEYHGRWGRHRQSGAMRWVDSHGNGLFDATHFDYPMVAPKTKRRAGTGIGDRHDPWHVEYDANNEPYRIYDRADLLAPKPPEAEEDNKKK